MTNSTSSAIRLNREVPKLDATNLDAMIDLFLNAHQARVSARTFKSDTYRVHFFQKWWKEYGPSVGHQMGKTDIERFASHLESYVSTRGERFSYHTRVNVLDQVRHIFRWAFANGYTERDFSIWVPRARGYPPKRKPVPVACLPDLMAAASKTRYAVRNQAILAVFIGTGMRKEECCNLNVEDIMFDPSPTGFAVGTIEIREGKGGKPRTVVFDEHTAIYLRPYLTSLKRKSGPLWSAHDSGMARNTKRISNDALYRIVKRIVHHARLDDCIQGPHDLRRLFATEWSRGRKGMNTAKALSLQLGHSTAATTLRYIVQDTGDLRDEYRNPLAQVSELAAQS